VINRSASVFCTVFRKSQLAAVRELARALRLRAPGIRFCALLVDRLDGFFDPNEESFPVISSGSLEFKGIEAMRFQYSAFEFARALKPAFFEHLLKRASRLVFLDCESRHLPPIAAVWRLLKISEIVLRPRLTRPGGRWSSAAGAPGAASSASSRRIKEELRILKTGSYDLSFVALRSGPACLAFLRWWRERLRLHGYDDPEWGLYVDQRWSDLVPCLFSNVGLLREPALLRGLAWQDNRCRWPYSFDFFDNGVRIPSPARRLFAELREHGRAFERPFLTRGRSFFRWINLPASRNGPRSFTRFWKFVYMRDDDLRARFPEAPRAPRGFLREMACTGRRRYGAGPAFFPVREELR